MPFQTGPLESQIGLGLAVQHIGPDLSIDGTRDQPGGPLSGLEYDPSLPTKVKAGVSYGIRSGERFSGLLCFEYDKLLDSYYGDPILHFGAELGTSFTALGGRSPESTGLRDHVAVRAGYVYDDTGQIRDWSYGAGLTLMHPSGLALALDFASVPQAEGLTRPWRGGTGLALRVEIHFASKGLWPDDSAGREGTRE